MPHATFKISPGVDTTKTPALNEAAISQSQLIRFVPDRTLGGLVQKLGGWSLYLKTSVGSIARALWGWEDQNVSAHLAVGAEGIAPLVITSIVGNGTTVTVQFAGTINFPAGNSVLITGVNPSGYNGQWQITASTAGSISFASSYSTAYVSGGTIYGGGNSLLVSSAGSLIDITPQQTTINAAPAFSTTSGSNQVLVTLSNYGPFQYDSIYIKTPISIGGLVLFGQYQCYDEPTPSLNDFYIYAYDAVGNPTLATSTTTTAAVPLFTVSTGSSIVTVTLNNHNYLAGQEFPILVSTNVGGIVLYGQYKITTVLNPNQFQFAAQATASVISVTNATGTGVNATLTLGTAVKFTAAKNIIVSGINPSGYNATATVGSSTFGTVTYPNATSSAYVSGGTVSGEYSIYENYGNAYIILYNGGTPATSGSGYGVGPYGAGPYGVGQASTTAVTGVPINAVDWTLDNWGGVLIANPYLGPIYYWDPSGGETTANVIAEAPPVSAGCFVAMPQRQLISWGCTYNGFQDPLLVRYSDVNNFESWTPKITNQAGSYRLTRGSKIIQGIQGPQQGLLWTDLGIWALQYIGPQDVYGFNEIGTNCGLIGRHAAGTVNGVVYWMGQSQFFRLSGSGVDPIACPVWDTVFQELDRTYADRIIFAGNSRFGEISWYFPTNGSNGVNTNYIKYNYVLQQWDYGQLSRSAWINESVLGAPIGATVLDSTNSSYIVQHETSANAVASNGLPVPMISYFQTGYFEMSEADVKMFVDQIWPDMKWGYFGSSNQGANVQMTFYVVDYPGQTPTAYGPYTLTQSTTWISPRFRGRLVSIRLESSDIDSFWRLGAIRYRLQQDGKF